MLDVANEYAVALGKRTRDQPLSFRWFTLFMSRWPDLDILKPRGHKSQKDRAMSSKFVNEYYKELGKLMKKYNLSERPERLFNVDENCLSINDEVPSDDGSADNTVSQTAVTVIGCGNAAGEKIPPYFIFPVGTTKDDLKEVKHSGAGGMEYQFGLTTSEAFRHYVENHLMKFLPERTEKNPVIVFYEGHRYHINIALINWAQSQHVYFFPVPAHASHVLQMMDIGCLAPFEKCFANTCKAYQDRINQDWSGNVCVIACDAYEKALSQNRLEKAFRLGGIHPFEGFKVTGRKKLEQSHLEDENDSVTGESESDEDVEQVVETPPVKKMKPVQGKQNIDKAHCSGENVEDGVQQDYFSISMSTQKKGGKRKRKAAKKAKSKVASVAPVREEIVEVEIVQDLLVMNE